MSQNTNDKSNERRRITSEDLAALIIDALIDANIVQKEHLEEAIAIAAEEIEARKAVGDY